MKKALFLAVITILILITAMFAHSVEAKANYGIKGIGAHFTYSHQPEGWLPPLTYDWYFIGDPLSTPTSVLQYLKDNDKKIGVKLYFSNPDWVMGRMDSWLAQNWKYLTFATIWEENSDQDIARLNETYDYLKGKFPQLKLYQWAGTNKFDFQRLGELKADGFVMNPRWWYVGQNFEEYFLYPALATGKPLINMLYIGLGSELLSVSPRYKWEYAIGQYQLCVEHRIPVVIYQAFYPSWEEITQERLEIIVNGD